MEIERAIRIIRAIRDGDSKNGLAVMRGRKQSSGASLTCVGFRKAPGIVLKRADRLPLLI